MDAVNHPRHYNRGGIEAIDAIRASMTTEQFIGFLKGNAVKYLFRMDYKGRRAEDARKAEWYVQRLVEEIERAK